MKTITSKISKAMVGVSALILFAGATSARAAGKQSCATIESSRSYLSGLCPSNHQEVNGDQKVQLSYQCEMMANNDFIVNELAKTTICDPATPTTYDPSKPLTTAQTRTATDAATTN